MQILRYLHVGARLSLGVAAPVEKSALSKLRKATGYSFSKCKEALVKHQNDIKQAECWLKSEAQAHGWEKATKLKGRSTAQGLVSILSTVPNNTVIVEVNCETDFVARNKKFQNLVQKILNSCSTYLETSTLNQSGSEGTNSDYIKVAVNGEEISNFPYSSENTSKDTEGSRYIKDEIALSIGELGENIKTRRGYYFRSNGGMLLSAYIHPPPDGINTNVGFQFGKYGAVVAFRPTKSNKFTQDKKRMNLIGRQLCQHIVGMNPKEIGSIEDVRKQNVTQEQSVKEIETENIGKDASNSTDQTKDVDETSDSSSVLKDVDEDITVLVHQDFLLDADITVGEFLLENSIEVIDFIRFEVGENTEEQLD